MGSLLGDWVFAQRTNHRYDWRRLFIFKRWALAIEVARQAREVIEDR